MNATVAADKCGILVLLFNKTGFSTNAAFTSVLDVLAPLAIVIVFMGARSNICWHAALLLHHHHTCIGWRISVRELFRP
jgi:hypothetical protein